MKKTRKVTMVLFVCAVWSSVIICINSGMNFFAESADVTISIPNEVISYAEDNKEEIFSVVIDAWELQNVVVEELEYGTPFVIYDGEENPDAVYHLPVEYENEIIVVVTILNTDKGFLYQCSDEYISLLNGIDYVANPAIFYEISDELYAETNETVECVSTSFEENFSEPQGDGFVNMSYHEKCETINKWISNMVILESVAVSDEGSDLDMIFQKTLTLYYPMGQYGYQMCWAASVATVINYLNDTGVTPFLICSRMGIGYDEGGTVYDEQMALAKYVIEYNYIRNTFKNFSMTVISDNIDEGYPLILNLVTADGSSGHAVTIYGYSSTSNTIYYWDSNLNKGNGSRSTGTLTSLEYTFLEIDDVYYGWHSSLSKK